MMGLPSHLREDRLFDGYLSVRAGEPLDPRTAEHLAECPECAARFDELRQFMDGLRDEADAELDAVFPADVLRQQQQQIARRLSAVGRSARVIHFPAPAATAAPPSRRRPILPRWAAGAAAAGLFVGVAAGMFFKDAPRRAPGLVAPLSTQGARLTSTPRALENLVAPPEVTAEPLAAAALTEQTGAERSDRDDAFLTELEVAAGGPRTAELAPFDALTPHIREISLSLSR